MGPGERETEKRYRPELQGLRAFAVIPVVMFHAGASGLPGGYLGVDVFFVLSGFLISCMIIPQVYAGTFRPGVFYAGRIKRLAPAALLTLLLSLALGPYVLFSWQTEELGVSALLSILGLANLWFSNSVDYFMSDADNHMLLHFWSLSIEMQFYLLASLLFVCLTYARLPREYLVLTLIIFCLIGEMASLAISATDPQSAFFSIEARLYEFAAGATIGALVLDGHRIKGRLGNWATTIGVLILIACYELPPLAHTGPLASLPIIVGVLLILVAEPTKGIGFKLLTSRIALRVGACSYGLYLFHQPLLVWLRQFNGSIDLMGAIGAIALAYALAEVSYHCIERHIQANDAGPKWTAIIGGSAMALVAVISVQTMLAAPTVSAVAPEDRDIAISARERVAYVKEHHAYFEGRGFPPADGRKRLLLIGDSHSQDMTNMLIENGYTGDYQLSTHYVPYYCQIAFFEGAEDHVATLHRGTCKDRQSLLPSPEIVAQADLIIVAARWEPWAAERAVESLTAALGAPEAPVVVTGPKIFRETNDENLRLRQLLGMSKAERAELTMRIPDRVLEADGKLRRALEDTPFLYHSSLEAFCDTEARRCPVFTEDGELITYDGMHLTQKGARWAGQRLLETLPYLVRTSGY